MDVLTTKRAVLGESPLWHRAQGVFYWVDILGNEVLAYDPHAESNEVVYRGEKVTALSELKGGGLVMVTPRGLYTWQDGEVDTLAPLSLSKEVRTNDGKCDPFGRVWFGTMDLEARRPLGELFVFDGRDVRLAQDQVILSNGLGWSPQIDTFYHADTTRRLIYRYDYDGESGAIANREVFVDLNGSTAVPDGLAVDVDGNIWVAMWNGWCINVFDSTGRHIHKESLAVQRPTSVAFGGPGLSELYVTTATEGFDPAELEERPHDGKLLRFDPGTTGLPIGVFSAGG
jgi:sugar lactone lactonase YvrE